MNAAIYNNKLLRGLQTSTNTQIDRDLDAEIFFQPRCHQKDEQVIQDAKSVQSLKVTINQDNILEIACGVCSKEVVMVELNIQDALLKDLVNSCGPLIVSYQNNAISLHTPDMDVLAELPVAG
jgi:hypothetical protein